MHIICKTKIKFSEYVEYESFQNSIIIFSTIETLCTNGLELKTFFNIVPDFYELIFHLRFVQIQLYTSVQFGYIPQSLNQFED